MTNHRIALSRRNFVQRVGALAVAGMTPVVVRGQGAPMQLGVLTPLTGAGGFDGPRMLKAMQLAMLAIYQDGTYRRILTTWNLLDGEIPASQIVVTPSPSTS